MAREPEIAHAAIVAIFAKRFVDTKSFTLSLTMKHVNILHDERERER